MATRYLVQWEMDIWADSPRNAAEQAWAAMRHADSTANVFTVAEVDEGANQSFTSHQVDLSD